MKYLIIRDRSGLEFPVFCTAPMTHADMAAAWRRDETRRVLSAGFCMICGDGSAEVFGESTSLKLKPGPKDAAIITAFYGATLSQSPRN